MKVIILAAGQGTRLRPYTDDRPKCMVELKGKPLLHHQLEVLEQCKVQKQDIALAAGYLQEALVSPGIKQYRNEQYATTNMVSTLFAAEEFMQAGEDLIISYGDIVYEPKVLESLLNTDAPIAISVDKNWFELWRARLENPLDDAETLKLDNNGFITELGKQPTSLEQIEGQYMGLIKIRGDFIKTFKDFYHQLDKNAVYDGKDFDNMYMTSFLQLLIDAAYPAKAAFTHGGWLEVDTVEDLAFYEKMMQEDKLSKLIKL